MRAYLGCLDTVNYNIDTLGINYEFEERKAYAQLIISRLIYDEIRFSPNQVIDLKPFRNIYSKLLNKAKITLCLPERYEFLDNPWEDYLCNEILLRGKKDSYKFSSVMDSMNKKRKWEEFLNQLNENYSKTDLLKEASKNGYGEIIEWVKKIDKDFRYQCKLVPFLQKVTYSETFSFLKNIVYEYHPNLSIIPNSRSQSYELIDSLKIPQKEKEIEIHFADLVSEISNSSCADAKLVLSGKNTENFALNWEEIPGNNICIDFNKIFEMIPDLIDAIWNADQVTLSRAYKEAGKFVQPEVRKIGLVENNENINQENIIKGLKLFFEIIYGCNNLSLSISTLFYKNNQKRIISGIDKYVYFS